MARLEGEDRGHAAMYAVMYGVEGAVAGSCVAAVTGAFWVIGAALGGVVTLVLLGLLMMVPQTKRAAFIERMTRTRDAPPPAAPKPVEPRKPYWPQ